MLGKRKPTLTRGQIEADISAFASRFEKEYLGRGPLETKTTIAGDLVIVRHRMAAAKAETTAAASSENVRILKAARSAMLESSSDGAPIARSVP